MPGHTVLAVPVPELDGAVRARTRRHDATFLAADPGFGQAHVTLLAPWLAAPTGGDLDAVGSLLAHRPAFDFDLGAPRCLSSGLIAVDPEPAAPFAELTAALAAAFPHTPPYGGEFEPVPHLTLDHTATGASAAELTAELEVAVGLPVRCRATSVQLQWWAAGACRVLHVWPLPGAAR